MSPIQSPASSNLELPEKQHNFSDPELCLKLPSQSGDQLHVDLPCLEYSPDLSLEQEHELYRKVDLRLIPILSLMYFLNYLARGMHRCYRHFISSILIKP
jgi:hypothetical protein